MRPQRLTRVNQLLKQEVAEQLFRIMHEPGFDAAACTVTRVITSSDLRHARVLMSIRGEPDRQQETARPDQPPPQGTAGHHQPPHHHEVHPATGL
jgi:ribosome-binding factor A